MGSTHEDRESAEVSVFVLFFVMYLVIMLYGMNVARSVIDEKTSRIFEVMLATIRPEAMMAGKILGVGSVGLTQVGIWLAAPCSLAGRSMACTWAATTSTSRSPPPRSSSSSSTSSSAISSTPPSPPRSAP
jgi:ABC-type Na+ efflux pump permease subunit